MISECWDLDIRIGSVEIRTKLRKLAGGKDGSQKQAARADDAPSSSGGAR
jgi:hypothetical protein